MNKQVRRNALLTAYNFSIAIGSIFLVVSFGQLPWLITAMTSIFFAGVHLAWIIEDIWWRRA